MPTPRLRQLFKFAGVAAVAAFSASDPTSADPGDDGVVGDPRDLSAFELATRGARFAFTAETGQLVATSANGRTRYPIDLTVTIDGIERPVALRRDDVVQRDGESPPLSGTFLMRIGDERERATLELAVDPVLDALTASVTIAGSFGKRHKVALHLSVPPGPATIFVPEHGELGDLGEVETRSVVLDDDVHPVAVAVRGGDTFTVGQNAPEIETQPGAKPRLTATLAFAGEPGQPLRAEASILLGNSSDVFWAGLYDTLRVPTARVTGVVAGTTGRADVYALDEAGHALVRIPTTAGHFVVDAPFEAVRWYATLETAHTTTAVTRYQPGSPGDLQLDMLPGGELHVRVVDADTGLPVLARIAVRGVDGAVDPAFGHDFRSSGAGPLVDVRSGELDTVLPPGRYRVSALKGLEWSIDSEVVDMASGHGRTVELRPRHVVPTPGLV
jgi:hypothetical protein